MTAQSLFEKVWQRHVVVPETDDTPAILYIDLHLTHEVTSPQAFDVLRARKLPVRRLDRTLATMDHSTPTDTAQIFGGLPQCVRLSDLLGPTATAWRVIVNPLKQRLIHSCLPAISGGFEILQYLRAVADANQLLCRRNLRAAFTLFALLRKC